jgi:hypothetical protein
MIFSLVRSITEGHLGPGKEKLAEAPNFTNDSVILGRN